MDKMNKKIPALRFPEFEREWERKKLGDISVIIMGQSPEGDSYNTKSIGMALINGPVEFTDRYPVKIKWTSKPTKYCQDGDILFCVRGSTTGRMNIANDKYCIGRGVAAIRANSNNLTSFIEFQLIKNLMQILSLASGSTFVNLDSKSLKEVNISAPSLPEQQKIADFLTAVDDKINLLTRKKTLLEQYKKGVMQKIFSQEIRFPDFDDEWVPKTIGNIGDLLGGGTPDTRSKEFWLGAIPWISSSDLCENNIFKINFNKHINETAIAKSATKLIPAKSILIVSRVGVGKVAVNKRALCTSQDFINLVAYEDYYIFLAYLIKTKTKKLLEFNQGTSIKGFVKNDFEQLKLYLPTIPEQQKISNFLTGIDKKIELVNTQLEKTKEWKKGLLQQMFV